MAFQQPIPIRRAIEHIRRGEYVLPAIQREFVWDTDQICQLFDSLMRGYPIGSFLFWKVDRDHCQEYTFYGFLEQYHERDQRHNPRVDLTGDQGVTAILDGQQRLTSLFIGLRGTYAYRLRYQRRNNPDAYPKRRLYLNLSRKLGDEEVDSQYEFRFLTDDEASDHSGGHWFRVGDVLQFGSLKDVYGYLKEQDLLKEDCADDCLTTLYEVVCEKPLINFFEEEQQELDKVLNIFIRCNSGGTPLNYSDLLLSIATAQWTEIDAREAVHDLVDDLNRLGDGFDFDKDFVLKSSLVLADLDGIAFKVDNFNRANTEKIEAAWARISTALQIAVSLAASFGYNGKTLTAKNVLIPVAYYVVSRNLDTSLVQSGSFRGDRDRIRNWIARALLKTGTFGSGLDTTLRATRNVIRAAENGFPLSALDSEMSRIGKSLRFEDEEIDELLDEKYGRRLTFSVLSLLYPGVDFNNHFHEDHIFPKSRFRRPSLRKAGVAEDSIDEFVDCVDRVPNLQLLEGIPNQEKSDGMPADWVAKAFPTSEARSAWFARNYVDAIPAEMGGFLEFYQARRSRMKDRLAVILDSKDSKGTE